MNRVDPLAAPGGPGYGMRAFFVVMLFVIAFLLFLNGSLKNVDLTSNTPGAAGAAPVQAAAPADVSQPQVITIQENPSTTTQSNLSVPVTGGCSDPYTVQPGDTLLQIANNCNTTLAAVRLANPQVTDANLIYPGQKLHIPGGNAVAQAQPSEVVPATGNETSQPAAPVIIVTPTALVPLTGAYPMIAAGTGLEVKGIGYPPNTSVNVAIGPQNQGYALAANGVTDANGNLIAHITIPPAQNAQTLYVVVVATTSNPPVQAMSRPFYIGPSK